MKMLSRMKNSQLPNYAKKFRRGKNDAKMVKNFACNLRAFKA
jgi:hypothetical protein